MKIMLSHDVNIPGYGIIGEGTAFVVDRYNSRFVYVKLSKYCTLRLARKGDCTVISWY